MRYNRLEYLVKWKGYDKSHNQWEECTQLHAKSKRVQFHRKNPSTACHINAALFDSISCTRADLATSDPPSKFAHKKLWQTIQVFYGHIDCLSERRCKLALEACTGSLHWKLLHWKLALEFNRDKCNNEEDISRADASMISAYRADLYIPESPQKS
jgi:hypothetical protein